jgi:MFS superfamily sulfate permease-like transporter
VDDPQKIARIFKALSVDTRVQILQLLKEQVLCVGALAARLEVSSAAVSQHLRILRDADVVVPFFGGMPMCHGAGGLAGQHYFGARTGGTNIIEGSIEVALGLFLAGSIATLFAAFPMAIVGGMMLMVGIELFKFARELRLDLRLIPVGAAVVGSVALNMAVGFAAGMILHYLILGRPEESDDEE